MQKLLHFDCKSYFSLFYKDWEYIIDWLIYDAVFLELHNVFRPSLSTEKLDKYWSNKYFTTTWFRSEQTPFYGHLFWNLVF